MSSLTARPQIAGQDLFVAQASPQAHRLGEQMVTSDGRKFRYVSVEPSASTVTGQTAGASLVAGDLLQSAAQITAHQNLATTAFAIGVTQITATLGATASYANQYSEGYAAISTTPGIGIVYGVAGHALVAASGLITLNLTDSIQVALTSSSKVDLIENLYKGVIQSPVTTATGIAVGVASWALPALTTGGATGQNFGWILSGGPVAVLCKTTTAIGASLMANTATAGSVTLATAGTPVVGSAMAAFTDARRNVMYCTID